MLRGGSSCVVLASSWALSYPISSFPLSSAHCEVSNSKVRGCQCFYQLMCMAVHTVNSKELNKHQVLLERTEHSKKAD